MQWYADLISHALWAYTSALLICCLVDFLLLKPVNQWRRQLGSVAGLLAKISGWLWQCWWNHELHTTAQSLCFWPSNFNCWIIVKLVNCCALKLEKSTRTSSTWFFSCYLPPKVSHGQDCIKTSIWYQNLILISKWWKNHSTMITFLKSYSLCISFQLLCTNFSGCARIAKCA